MTPQTLFRLSGLAALLAGAVKVVIAIVHYLALSPDLTRSSVMTLSAWQLQQAVDLGGNSSSSGRWQGCMPARRDQLESWDSSGTSRSSRASCWPLPRSGAS